MPRITGDNIAEHVASQQAAVLDAAVRLFATRGYKEVSLGDIAAEVGLARNSLYRYFPDKAHLLLAWYRVAVPRTIDEWRRAVDDDRNGGGNGGGGNGGDDNGGPDPALRLQRWARTYLEWASSPEHRLVAPFTDTLDSFDDDTRADVAALHRSMMAVVAEVLRDAGVGDDQIPGTLDLLTGLVLGAARSESAHGLDPATRARLDAAITAIIATA